MNQPRSLAFRRLGRRRPQQPAPTVKLIAHFAMLALAVGCMGCSNQPPAIGLETINGSKAGAAAIELLDGDGDQLLTEVELAGAPALLKHLTIYDSDGDGAISSKEIAERVDVWKEQKVGLKNLTVTVKLNRRPLGGALVEFLPEEYLGDAVKPASGVTNSQGIAMVTHADEDLPKTAVERRIRGIGRGTYKIKVTHPKVDIPAKYNKQTTLGAEVARDTMSIGVDLDLSTRD